MPLLPKVNVGTTTVQVKRPVGMDTLEIPNLLSIFPCTGHVMPYFKHTLIGIGSICNSECKVVSAQHEILVYNSQQQLIITGGWKPTCSKLWRVYLLPDPSYIPLLPNDAERASMQVFSLYNIPSFEGLVRTSMQQQALRCETLGSMLLKIIINILGQDSPTPMLLMFFYHWTKSSWYIFSNSDRVWDQLNLVQTTKHIVTQH